MSLLDAILDSKWREIRDLASASGAYGTRTPIDVASRLRRSPGAPLRIIAEIKMKSPSAGRLSRRLDAPSRAEAYAAAGATMVSVLCDRPFFDGGWDHLAAARARLDALGADVPLLAKEFVVDEAQIACAKRHGADAVLLIARIVDRARLAELARAARDEGLEPLVEIVDERELDLALAAGARTVGVNVRDLDTLAMDAARAVRVLAAIPDGVVSAHLSGLKREADIAGVARSLVHAALVGEALMREDDPRPTLARFVAAAEI